MRCCHDIKLQIGTFLPYRDRVHLLECEKSLASQLPAVNASYVLDQIDGIAKSMPWTKTLTDLTGLFKQGMRALKALSIRRVTNSFGRKIIDGFDNINKAIVKMVGLRREEITIFMRAFPDFSVKNVSEFYFELTQFFEFSQDIRNQILPMLD